MTFNLKNLLQALLLVSVGFILAASASAQSQNNEVGLLLGAEFIPANSTASSLSAPLSYGDSVTFQLNYARRLKQNNRAALWLEFPALAGPSHSITNGSGSLPISLATFFATPSFRVAFSPASRFTPWVSFGGGYALFETSESFANGSPNPNRLTNTAALQFGGGLDVKTPIHILLPIGFRAEVRDFYALDVPAFAIAVNDQHQHNINLSGGLILRF